MSGIHAPVRFFLGANTPGGFVGYIDDLYDAKDGWQAYIIKSGPGTGKSSLMRAVLDKLTDLGQEAEVICCSSDPNSLDGVLFPAMKMCILDGTAPHVIEPSYWGAVEQIIPLASCMDTALLHRQAPAVIAATDANKAMHARCRKFLGAAASLIGDSTRIAAECTDEAKAVRCAARIAAREFGPLSETPGREKRRFLSAVAPDGLITFHETLQALCPRIYAVEDDYGAASRLFFTELRQRALAAGLDIITCACPLAPYDKIEHLLVPSLGLGFTTSNPWHKADFPVYRRIHAARFTDAEKLRLKRQLLSFNRRAARELLGEAVAISAEAKALHDKMEQFNIAAMDWQQAEDITRSTATLFAAAALGAAEA